METTSIDQALTRLEILVQDRPELAEAAAYYQRLIPAMHAAGANITAVHLPKTAPDDRTAPGSLPAAPLLVDQVLEIKASEARDTFLSICQAISPPGPPDSQNRPVRKIVSLATSGGIDPLQLLSAAASNADDLVDTVAAQKGLDPRLLALLAQNTLKVFLRAWRTSLEKQVDLDHWQRGVCLFCGALPSLAEIQGVESARHLRCLRCGAGWPYPNLKCAFCGNENYRMLGILQVENEGVKYYAHTCDECKHYLKTIVTFEPTPVDLLLVEDLATLHLDRLALEKGYRN